MFYYVKGELVMTDPQSAVVDCGGVGYKLTVSMNTLSRLTELGKKVCLYTHFSVREDAVELFGFYDTEELYAFRLLISVSGVGPKAAIAILSLLSPAKFAVAVSTGDTKTLSKASGVGAKTAARIVLELKDKVSATAVADDGEAVVETARGGIIDDAIEALMVLGYQRQTAQKALAGCKGETLEELKERKPDAKSPYRTRVMLVGSEIDDPEFTKLIEMCGAYVCADRYCFGSLPGREQITVKEGQHPLDALAEHYMMTNECPRTMGTESILSRRNYMYDLAKEYKAEGIILQNMKFCEYWGYERAIAAKWLAEGRNLPEAIPTCQIERDYANAAIGQLRTRFQAFVESLEIKKIQAQD